jgi:hypothetical protein
VNSIAADTSFFSCFFCYLEDLDKLFYLLDNYSFYIGTNILNEIPKDLRKDGMFISKITMGDEYDYVSLMEPYFGRKESHLDDGEYQAIGMAYYLQEEGDLKYLIIDERIANKFVIKHFKILKPFLRGTIGFLRDCCCIDNKLEPDDTLKILNDIKYLVENSTIRSRPCSLDKKRYEEIIDPVILKIMRVDYGGF